MTSSSNIPEILVDLSPLRLGYCGLWEYAFQYGSTLMSLYNPSEFNITFLVPSNHPFPKDSPISYKHLSFINRHCKIWTKPYDLFHSISYPSPFMPHKKWFRGKFIATLHDLNFLYEKSEDKIRKYMNHYQENMWLTDQLVCISEYAKKDAEKYLKFHCPVEIIYNGVALPDNIQSTRPPFMNFINGPFLFSVSTFMKKKNLHTLIPMMEKLPDYYLVIAGKIIHKDYYEEVKKMVNKAGLDKRVIFAGTITNEEKKYLYRHCEAFVFPSIAEGFGIPPIEAMSYGKPVFVSTRTSLPEICGNRAFYWNNFDAAQMADTLRVGMKKYQDDSQYPNQLMEHAASYSWKENVLKHLDMYRKVLNTK